MEEYNFTEEEIERGKKYYWDYIKHTNEIFLYRANIFLLTETIFFAGFLSLLQKNHEQSNPIILLLFFMSFVVNLIWLYTSYKLLFISQKSAKRKLYEKKSLFYDSLYVFTREDRKAFFSSGTLLGILLPILFIIAWIVIILIMY